ncbi:MAG: PDGLE domain-containing protein [Actinobacteria bacterium]|nr:PDGLE domain-containing protein [Actinomycetota bacterium]
MDRRTWGFLAAGLLVTVVVAAVVSGFASSEPDGLEKVSIDQEFEGAAADHALADSPLADYGVDGIDNERVSTGVAGIVGVAITLAAMVGLLYGVRFLHRRRAAEG